MAAWDRVLRLLVAAALVLGAPVALRHHAYWIALVALVGGVQLTAAATGY